MIAPRQLSRQKAQQQIITHYPQQGAQVTHSTIDDLHERAILLWIYAKIKDPNTNPAHGIYFAITDRTWPMNEPAAKNAIDLCEAVNRAYGLPSFSPDERRMLNARAVLLYEHHVNGGGPINLLRALNWVNYGGLAVAGLSFALSGVSIPLVAMAVIVIFCNNPFLTKPIRNSSSWAPVVLFFTHCLVLAALWITALVRMAI